MSVFKHALANAKLLIIVLMLCFMCSMLLNSILGYFLYAVPNKITVYVPPRIPASGIDLKGGLPSDAEVFSFTYWTWQSLQTWPTDGYVDYKKNLNTFAPYVTPAFQLMLKKEGKTEYDAGFLHGHQQATFGASGSMYDPKNVKYIGHGTWLVHLNMRTINRVTPANGSGAFEGSHVDRDAETSYVFEVVQTNYAPNENYWHLQLAGYATQPKVIHIYK
tara:strand:- start:59567 stop:60223 length:657 start_codon:yes stop_codon:yes gene_type:complete